MSPPARAPAPARARTVARTRALARIAWRDARRHRGRSLLVLAMVALPVAALTAGIVFFSASRPTPGQLATDVLGNADIVVTGGDPDALRHLASRVPAGSATTVRTTVTAAAVVDGARHTVIVDDVLPDDPLLGPRYELLEGRAPRTAGEAAVAPAVLADLGAAIGDELVFDAPAAAGPPGRTADAGGGRGLRFTVTATVRRPERLAEPVALVPPGTLDAVPTAAVSAVFVDLPGGADPTDLPLDDTMTSIVAADLADAPFDDRAAAFGSMFGLAALGLAETGMVVVAAFVVGTQRRLRRVGLVAAVGGEPRHARTMVLCEGVVLGFLGAIAGVGLGVAFTTLLSPQMDQVAGRVTAGAPLPLPLLAGAVALGTVAATLAVAGQARLAHRIGVVDALAGRLPAPTPPGRVARRGVLVALAGAAIIAAGSALTNEGVQVLGVGVMVAGTLMAVPLLVTAVGRVATALPLPLRLAARDTARHGRRAGAAVAGAALALALPVTVATLTLAENARTRAAPPLAVDHILVSGGSSASMADAPVIDAAVRSATGVEAAVPLTPAVPTASPGAQRAAPDPALVLGGPGATPDDEPLGTLTVGGPELLRALHAGDRVPDLRAGAVVVIGEDAPDGGVVRLVAPGDTGGGSVALRAVASGGPGYPSLTRFVISPGRAAQIGLAAAARGPMLYRATSPVAPDTLDEIRGAIATIDGVWVLGAEDTLIDSGAFQALLLAVTIPIALATLGVSTAMVVAESRRDQAVLAAVGAGPGTRRRIVGGAALVLGLLAGLLALPAGFVPVTLLLHLTDGAYPVVVPWTTMAGALGAAFLAGLGGLLLSREPPPAEIMRPLS